MSDVGTLGGSGTYIEGMSSDGRLFGASDLPGDMARHAFLYSDGIMSDLGTLGGTHSMAAGTNAAGQVFGNSDVSDTADQRGFLYQDGTMTDLGSLDADTRYSFAADMNESGQVVGTSSGRAFLYIDGKMWDVEALIDPTGMQEIPQCDKRAIAINDAGQILVSSFVCPFDGGYLESYCYRSVLTPRPAPSAAPRN
jgi:probable HAF family extracellular repeat protein